MNPLEALLSTEPFVLLDGAMGTMLMAEGLTPGDPPEGWSLLHPDLVRKVHRAYIQAGARVILTNSFGGTHYRLKLHGYEDRVAELNHAAAVNARAEADAAPHPVVVAGSLGPTGELLQPYGLLTIDAARQAFADQAQALAQGGVDVFWIETMSDLEEVRAAIEGARSVSDLPIVVTMTFDTKGHTMMGVSPLQALETLKGFDLAAIGANCGNGPAEIEAVVAALYAQDPQVMLVAKSNAGIPKVVGGDIIYDGTPEVMAQYARHVFQAGVRLIGGCCGSTPTHIRAMATALGSLTAEEG